MADKELRGSLSVEELLIKQRELREKYLQEWGELTPDTGVYTLLWAVGEMGELIDIIKKKGGKAIVEDERVRTEFKKEFADVLMYMGDLLMCYGIDADEITAAYRAKHEYNMKRVYSGVTHAENEDNN